MTYDVLRTKRFMDPTTGWRVRDDLYCGRTTADDSDLLALQHDRVVPIGAVQHGSLERFSALGGRPLPFVQYAARVDQNAQERGLQP